MQHPAITAAPARSWADFAAVLGAGAIAGLAVALAAGSIATDEPAAITEAPTEIAPAVAPAPPAPPAPLAPPAPALQPASQPSSMLFVFSAGGATYVKLADLEDSDGHGDAIATPRHGRAKLSHDATTAIYASVAAVTDADVPAPHARWIGRRVEVDEVCTASVVGFAVVSRLVGDPDYAGVAKWTAGTVMKSGHAVLAARLDACAGSFARDATLAAIAVPTRRHDPALEAAARDALLASAVAHDVQLAWEDQQRGTREPIAPWYERATLTSEVLDHTTGATFVSVHGYVEHGCGDPEANVWGLFRVQPDGSLAAVQLRALGDIETIDALIDVDGDGQLDVLGRPWLGLGRMLARAGGEVVDQLALPLFGCPC
jgi:hypothetical protein